MPSSSAARSLPLLSSCRASLELPLSWGNVVVLSKARVKVNTRAMPKKIVEQSRLEPTTSRSVRSTSPSRSPSYGVTKLLAPTPSVSKTGTLERSKSIARSAVVSSREKLFGSPRQRPPEVSKVSSRAPTTPFNSLWKNCQLACIPLRSHDKSSSPPVQPQFRSPQFRSTVKSISFKNGVRMLWADKHRPVTLDSFDIHYQQAMHLSQLVQPHPPFLM